MPRLHSDGTDTTSRTMVALALGVLCVPRGDGVGPGQARPGTSEYGGHEGTGGAIQRPWPPEIVSLSTRLKGFHPASPAAYEPPPCLGRSNTDVRLNQTRQMRRQELAGDGGRRRPRGPSALHSQCRYLHELTITGSPTFPPSWAFLAFPGVPALVQC